MKFRRCIAFIYGAFAVSNTVDGVSNIVQTGAVGSSACPAVMIFLLNNFNRWICNNVLFVMHAPLG